MDSVRADPAEWVGGSLSVGVGARLRASASDALTGADWTYLEADEIAESGLGRLNNHLRVKIRTWGASRTHEAIREIVWAFDRA